MTSTLQTILGNLYVLVVLGPGDGREWGQSHKLTKGEGGLPPWATANGDADDNAD